MAVTIITDSTSCLPDNLRDAYGISVLSLSVHFGVESYREESLDNQTFYKMMANSKQIPTSSQILPDEIRQAFEDAVAAGDAVIGIFISSLMSGTYATAQMIREKVLEKYPDAVIELIDSRSNSMQLGFAVMAAAKAAQAGKSMEAILQETHDVIGRSRFLFVPEVLDYLKKGGRIGSAAALFGSILQIKPILTVVGGKVTVFDKVRTKAGAVERIIKAFLDEIQQKGLGEVIVHHINCEIEGARVAEAIGKLVGRSVLVVPIRPVVGLHVGPGTVGLVYYTLNT